MFGSRNHLTRNFPVPGQRESIHHLEMEAPPLFSYFPGTVAIELSSQIPFRICVAPGLCIGWQAHMKPILCGSFGGVFVPEGEVTGA